MAKPAEVLAGLVSDSVSVRAVECPLAEAAARELAAWGFVMPVELVTAAAKRRDEHAAGRYCALGALRGAGEQGGVGRGVRGEPLWPVGWVGSLAHASAGRSAAHAGGVAVAVVARADRVAALGVDCERVMSAERAQAIRSRIWVEDEEPGLARELATWSLAERLTLSFVAKEAIYKALSPVCGQFFGFEAARLESVSEARGRFEFALRAGLGGRLTPGWMASGRFARTEGPEGMIFAVVEVARI